MFCKCAKGGPDLRLCLVDGKPATFHRWVEEETALLKVDGLVKPETMQRITKIFHDDGVAGPGTTIEKLRTCFALVEYPDGSVGKVKPELIQFLD